MEVQGKIYQTVWMEGSSVFYIEQNLLPYRFVIGEAKSVDDCCTVIRDMHIRGAGAIGAMAGYAMALGCLNARKKTYTQEIHQARKAIEATRPTARNLFYATEKVFKAGLISPDAACREAERIAGKDADDSWKIGLFGSELFGEETNVLTHCNAGWLAFVDHGTALSPIYRAHEQGKKVLVYADETRPRSQGARLTAWELNQAGIPHYIIPDNAAAFLMAQGKIDLVITGADRIAANGDTANKIGTLEKAIAANYYNIPFYIAAPFSTYDQECPSGDAIPIEERDETEVLFQEGPDADGTMHKIRVASPGSHALNPAFDVTPATLIKGYITEKGILKGEELNVGGD